MLFYLGLVRPTSRNGLWGEFLYGVMVNIELAVMRPLALLAERPMIGFLEANNFYTFT